jgi:hypothetical protein
MKAQQSPSTSQNSARHSHNLCLIKEKSTESPAGTAQNVRRYRRATATIAAYGVPAESAVDFYDFRSEVTGTHTIFTI